MKPGTIITVVTVVLFVIAGALAAVNSAPVAFNFFVASATLPAGAIVALGVIYGALVMTLLMSALMKQRQVASTKALTKWEAEDQKLLTQVQSDREKQLEAKILTLETALARALKK